MNYLNQAINGLLWGLGFILAAYIMAKFGVRVF